MVAPPYFNETFFHGLLSSSNAFSAIAYSPFNIMVSPPHAPRPIKYETAASRQSLNSFTAVSYAFVLRLGDRGHPGFLKNPFG
jgi:hypothetical protein